jgi:hypothetical protein
MLRLQQSVARSSSELPLRLYDASMVYIMPIFA